VEVVRPRWSTWSFLVYAGGLVFATAIGGWVSYLATHSGHAAEVLWALLAFALLTAVAEAFRRTGHPVTAGVFAFTAVAGFVGFVAELWKWFGWRVDPQSPRGFNLSLLALELLWLAAAVWAVRRYRFPLIVAHIALATYMFLLFLFSNGGWWTSVVSIVVGLAFLIAAVTVDAGAQRPYGFWLHVAAGLAIGGGVLYWFRHGGTIEWTLVVLASIAYVFLASSLRRSSWAVLGVLGMFIAADHFVLEWTRINFFFSEGEGSRPWVPALVFTVMGALLVALGLVVSRRAQPLAD
jgi:hypothetical protein